MRRLYLSALLVVGLSLSACGGDDGNAEEPGASYVAQEFGVQIAQGQAHILVFDF
jgi:hypothetical protein